MSKTLLGIITAILTWILTGNWYQGAEYASVGGVQLDPELVKSILSIAAFFVPALISRWNPQLGELVKKLLQKLFPDIVPLQGQQAIKRDAKVADALAVFLSDQGDEEGAKKARELGDHIVLKGCKGKKR